MFKAKITFFGTDQGGRLTPPSSGYSPQIKVGDVYTSCNIESLSGIEVFGFDEEYEVLLRLRFPKEYGHLLYNGSEVQLYEGSKLIGQVMIIEMP